MRHLPAALATLALSIAPASAQSVLGSFSGTVGGEAREWHVLDMDGDPGASWNQTGPLVQATIFGFPEAGNLARVSGAVEISLTLSGQTDLALLSGYVTYYADGVRQLYVPEDDMADVRVTLTDARIEDERLHLTGAVEADLQRMVSIATETLDPDDRIQVIADLDLVLEAQ